MSKCDSDFTPEFDKNFKKTKSDLGLRKRIANKIEEILGYPYHYKPLRNVLKNRRRTQIGGYILIFEVNEEEKIVIFHSVKHHDEAYKS